MKTIETMKNTTMKLVLLCLLLMSSTISFGQTSQTYTTTTTWVCPIGVTTVQVEAWGAGGAGGGNTSNSDGAGGGGGGAYSKTTNVSVTPGTSYTVTIGAGGTGNTGNGQAGGDTWFKNTGTVLAKGGAGGSAVSGGNAGNGGNGGSASSSVGSTKFSGGNGGVGRNNNNGQGGPGGSSAGTAANGTSGPGSWSTVTASNAPSGGGKGGNGGSSGNDGNSGTNPGGGGGGSGDGNSDGGDGADGQIKLTYTCPTFGLTAAASATGPFCGVTSSVVTLKSSTLPSGTYVITYNLSGATVSTGNTVSMTFTSGSPGIGTFTTALLSAGTTNISVTNIANEGCNNNISTNNTASVVVTAAPTANAGAAINTCSTSGAINITGGSSASNNAGITWTSSGTGTFVNATSLTTCTYNPSAADKSAGSVTLTLTAKGNGTCADAVSTKTLTINGTPTANAGTTIATCSNSGAVNITAGASASNQASIAWTSSGSGTFTNATSLTNATYTPSGSDISAGTRTLTLTVTALPGCTSTSSNKAITISSGPSANAGTAIATCSNSGALNITSGSSATNQTSVIWSSNGSGTFTNANSLTTSTYLPSPADISAGSVTLTLTAVANGSCTNATSTKTLTINPLPTANAGNSVTTCSNSGAVNITSGSSASNNSGVNWTSNGGGTFTNATSLTNCNYTPSASDILAGSVTLTLTANGNGSCTNAVSTKILTITQGSVGGSVNSDATVCSGSNSGTLTLSGHIGNVTKWQSSTNGGSSWNDIVSTSTSHTYTNLTSNTMYRAVIQNASCPAINSSPATITVNASTAITNQPSSSTVCSGSNVTFTVAANGVSLTYRWQDNSTGSFTDISGANSNSLTLNGVTTSMNARQYKCIISGACGTVTSSTVTLNVNQGSVGGTVNSSATVCSGSNSGTLTLSGKTGNVIRWESSTNGGNSWSNINSTSTSRNYNNLTTTTMYRAVVQNGSCPSANSVAATITVNPASDGGDVGSSATVCSGANGGTLNLTGYIGSVVKWQFSTNGGNSYTDIANTNNSQSYSNLTTTTRYRAVVQSGSCSTSNSSSATITVSPATVGGILNSSTSVCSGSNSGTLTLNGETGSVQKWQSSTNGGSSWTDISSTSTNRSYTNLTTTTLYRVVVQSGSCASANSSIAIITMNPQPNLFSVTGGGSYCSGGIGVPVGLSGSQAGINYQLVIGGVNTGSPITGNGSSISFGNITAAGTYTVIASVASSSCSRTMTGNATVVSNAAPATPVVSPSSATIFPSDIQTLTASLATTNAAIGTGSSTNSSTNYPAPLGTYYGGARHQILILASELSAQGITAGEQIKSLSFNVSNTNNAHAMINYTISIGNTALSSLTSSFIGGLSQVYYSASYAPLTGINKFNFTSPFIWNGTSNIIVETVFNNNYLGTSSNPNCAVLYTSTSGFTSVNYSRADNAGAGNAPILALASNGTSTRRPNMVFGHSVVANIIWSPTAGLFTDANATIPYLGGNATMLFAQPSSSTIYSVVASMPSGCSSPSSSTASVNVVTTPPNCVTTSVGSSNCVTATTLNWTSATNMPSGYYVYLGTDNPPTNVLYQQDVLLSTSMVLPELQSGTTYYYQIAPYNIIGENSSCAAGSFVSGGSVNEYPSQAVYYSANFENTGVPVLPCGITKSDENFPNDGFSWYTSNIAPHSGTKHARIDNNTNNTITKDDWLYSAPMNLQAGKLYRIYWYSRASNAAKEETYEVYFNYFPGAALMMTSSTIFNGSTTSTTYLLDSSANIIPSSTGIYYYAFHANSLANKGSLYLDDIVVKEIPVTGLSVASCTTIPSLGDPLYCNPIYGATDYKYKIENINTGFSYEYARNLPIPDFRLKWAPGVVYDNTYDISVSYKKNNVWSPYGASCPVTIETFPIVQLRPSSCNISITNQSVQIFTDSVEGANDYEYRIVNTTLGYDHTWSRNSALTDYRLNWAYQYSPVLVQNLPYGYTYDVQVRALVGRTGPAYGSLPGVYGTFGNVCQITLAGNPQTQLSPASCGILLNKMDDPIYCIPIAGASDYQYHIENDDYGFDRIVSRNSATTDYRLSWIGTNTIDGLRFGTTYEIAVRAYVGGVWLNFGPTCEITTPAQPLTNLQAAYCNYTLPTFQSSVFCKTLAGVTNYRYHISGPNGYDRVIARNSALNDFKFSWTQLCCGQQNMLANTSYQVEVASYAGGIWSAYGPACSITTGASVPRYAQLTQETKFENLESDLRIAVYPNPAKIGSQYSIELNGLEDQKQNIVLTIYDVLGKKVYVAEIIPSQENKIIIKPETFLNAGIYAIEATVNNQIIRDKLIVE